VVALALAAVCIVGLLAFGATDRAPQFWQKLRANHHLKAIGCPRLPASARDVHVCFGGLFAKFLFLRFEASEEGASEFLQALKAGPAIQIGSQVGQVRIVSYEELFGLMEHATDEGVPFREEAYLVPVEAVPWLPWYNPLSVKHGVAYDWTDTSTAQGLRVYYDSDTHTVYLHWNRS
jgi:hypothetical protein